MMLRGRSKDRNRKVTPPGPVSMTNEQFAAYLSDLRSNRVQRPSGARPLPSNNRRDSDRGASAATPLTQTPEFPVTEYVPRSASVLSHRRAQSTVSTYSSVTSRTGRQLAQQPSLLHIEPTAVLKPSDVVPTATYIERGQRWMEKEEAVSLREAMEDMDLKKQEEEARLHSAAQDEASELVWQHQHPTAAINPHAPYRYNDHLRKNSYQHARTQSVGRYGGLGMATGLARDMPPRSVSGGSNSSGGLTSPRGRMSGDFSDKDYFQTRTLSPERANRRISDELFMDARSYGSMSSSSRPQGSTRKRSSGKRNVSGELTGTFTGEQIWEEPEQESDESPDRGRAPETSDMPAPLRIKPRNPLNRVQFAQDAAPRSSSTPPEPIKRLSTSEIHRNPPSQSRDPKYTANPPPAVSPAVEAKLIISDEIPAVPMKDGLEIRSDEIRQATSMRLKDRSPKLPTPTVVSDRPGRPIVSFDSNWKPKEADVKPEVRRRSPFDRGPNGERQSVPFRSDSKNVSTPSPTIHVPDTPSVEVNRVPKISVPTINRPESAPPVPRINLPDSKPSVPTINFPDSRPTIPTINLPASQPSVPTINFPDSPSISVSAPAVPTITIGGDSSTAQGRRPLPDPRTVAGRPPPRHHATAPVPRGHWSPAAGKRATATCHQCQLPIEGRVVKLSGALEHFHPECFICFTCGTGLESLEIHPEPSAKRAERLDRIKRRARGEEIPEIEGQTYAEDGDARQRFYCHLDFHETFAPKCKHCKTPIIGEHMVALGESWHYGHFFCAECGDPFEKGMTHIEKDGYAWCLSCQTKRTERRAPKCKKCRGPVIGEYVQALGGEWHEKCFRCATCKDGFDDGAFYPKQVGDETIVLCIQCIERELKA
ncbi:related to leupaxin [Phialocephala subalpina]|uniref:Related to leupaxin n=1 Tax=Phialocephala subalpina TaxID=576137 RepID=A0A1L7X6Z7_9HELO|nr:related to leupaxin [Phialocephala subalpina]